LKGGGGQLPSMRGSIRRRDRCVTQFLLRKEEKNVIKKKVETEEKHRRKRKPFDCGDTQPSANVKENREKEDFRTHSKD